MLLPQYHKQKFHFQITFTCKDFPTTQIHLNVHVFCNNNATTATTTVTMTTLFIHDLRCKPDELCDTDNSGLELLAICSDPRPEDTQKSSTALKSRSIAFRLSLLPFFMLSFKLLIVFESFNYHAHNSLL